MLRVAKILICLCLCFTGVQAAGDAGTVLLSLLNNMRSMQADFSQTIRDSKGKILNQATGLIALQRPGKFRWEVKQPNSQLVVTNGKRVWVYDPDLAQVTIRILTQEAGEAPALLLSNTNTALTKNFIVQMGKQNANAQEFILIPKKRDET